jgi:short-subunit dehydrogenase
MDELKATRLLAVVTGASSGIGYHLARIAAEQGHDLVVVAETLPMVPEFEALGAQVTPVQADMATSEGAQAVIEAIGERQVDALMTPVGRATDFPFLSHAFDDILHLIEADVIGTLRLVQHVAQRMTQRVRGVGNGRILLVGAGVGERLGPVSMGTRGFIDDFALGLRHELNSTRVTVTKVNPGHQADPREFAQLAFEAMVRGEAGIVAGIKNQPPVYLMKKFFNSAQRSTHR